MPGQDNNNTTPVRKDASGLLVECLSTDGATCSWGSATRCATLASTAGSFALKPIKCTAAAMNAGSGWCYSGAVLVGLASGEFVLHLWLLGAKLPTGCICARAAGALRKGQPTPLMARLPCSHCRALFG